MHNRNQELIDIENKLSTVISNLLLAKACYHNIRNDRIPSGSVDASMFDATSYINRAKELLTF